MATVHCKPGDVVKLRLAQEELEGTFLESSDSSVILLKLASGYNIGIPKEHVLASRVLKKAGEDKFSYSIPQRSDLPSIGLVITGGTIASKLDARTGGVKPLTDVGEFANFYPELFQIANVKHISVPFMILSESMSSEQWIKIAEEVQNLVNDPHIQGVIVMHGTDTLHYTAAALSFFLRGLTKPVVLTYSQRSIDRASSDAHLNLQCAARMALSDAAEVMLVGHASIQDDYCFALRGTKVRKLHSSRRDAFQPVNAEPLARVWPDKIEFLESYRKRGTGKTKLDTAFTDKVALVKFYPGQGSEILDFYALKHKGIVIESLGLGHVAANDASHHNWIPALKKHIRAGFVVCMAPQTVYGRVDPYVYSNGRDLLDAGVIFLEDMLPETALVKLGFVLGHHGWKAKVKEMMLTNFVGELNPRIGV